MCPKLFGNDSHAFALFFSRSATSKIIGLPLRKATQICISPLINSTSISEFDAHSRQLQSISTNPLYIPRVITKAGTRAFSVAAPTLRNWLLSSVKLEENTVSFRRRLTNHHLNKVKMLWHLSVTWYL